MKLIRRALTTTTVAAGALVLLSGTALAHDCFVGTPTTNAPASDNWHAITAEQGALWFGGFEAACPEAVDAGYAALKAEGLPSSIRVFTGGPKGVEHFALGGKSATRSDGKGLEAFPESELAFQMVGGYIAGASKADCA